MPSRVIDVGPADGSSEPFLYCKTGEEADKYIALSHCWGKSSLITTTKDTLDQRRSRISFVELPPLFQDAVTLTRRLGVKYLWIDSLCIIQGDKLDWEREASQMASIYRGSYLTISAAMPKDSSTGFFLPRNSSPVADIELKRANGESYPIFVRRPLKHDQFHGVTWEPLNVSQTSGNESDEFPLFKRAWCYQERLLACRVLHFLDSEMVFECNTSSNCECGYFRDDTGGFKATFGSRNRRKPGDWMSYSRYSTLTWKRIVEDYTMKSLTYQNDSLPALSGIVKLARSAETDIYLAGLWGKDLDELLVWKSVRAKDCYRPTYYLAPSFSWASRVGPARYEQWDTECKKTWFTVLDGKTVPKGIDEDGALYDGHLKLRGCLFEVDLGCTCFEDAPCKFGCKPGERQALRKDLTSFDTVKDFEAAHGKKVSCMAICSNASRIHFSEGLVWSLLLIPASSSPECFRRIGITRLYGEKFDGLPEQEIVLV